MEAQLQTQTNKPQPQKSILTDKEIELVKASTPKLEELEKVDLEMNNASAAVLLSKEEEKEFGLSAGLRGQIKKILRSFKDDYLRPLIAVDKNQKLIASQIKQLNDNYHMAFAQTSRRFEKQFSYLVNMFLIRLEERITYHEIRSKAMLDELLTRLHKLESASLDHLLDTIQKIESTTTDELEPKVFTADDLLQILKNPEACFKIEDYDKFIEKFDAGMNEHESRIRARLKEAEEQKKKSADEQAKNAAIQKAKQEAFGKAEAVNPKEKEEDHNGKVEEKTSEEKIAEEVVSDGRVAE